MHQSEAVRKHTVWYATVQMITALRRTIAATTTLALYSIISGALALFVPSLPYMTNPNFSQCILDFMPYHCPSLP